MHQLRRFTLRIVAMEALMQYVWQFRLWPAARMFTTDGRRVQILDPGLHNHDAGPDFTNAKILIGGVHWVGNVEIHVRASDWYRHHHDTDKAYDSVVLHVVDSDDAEVFRSDGQKIPQMVMKCSPDFSIKYHEMVNNKFRELPCGNEIATLPGIYVTDWLTALAFERLYAKAQRIDTFLRQSQFSWSETIYITMARALGFSTNSDPFQLLAQSTPLRYMLKHTDSVESVEAILFGQAGLLDNLDPGEDRYLNKLKTEYAFLSTKYSMTRSHGIVWKMSRMRPQNFPHRRIAALARMICGNIIFTNRILELQSPDEAIRLFKIKLDGYWAKHYNFSPTEEAYSSNAFGVQSINTLLINVVAPLIFAYAQTIGDERRTEFAVDLLQQLRPEANRIVDTFSHAGITPKDAFTTQAMIQLRREYCEPRKCIYCRLGHRLLAAKVPR